MKKLLLPLLFATAIFSAEPNSDEAFEAMLLKFASESFINEFEGLKQQSEKNTKEIQNLKDIFYSDDFLASKKENKPIVDDGLKKEISEVKKERNLLKEEFEHLKRTQSELYGKIDALEQKISSQNNLLMQKEEEMKKRELEAQKKAEEQRREEEAKRAEEQKRIEEQRRVEEERKALEEKKLEAQKKALEEKKKPKKVREQILKDIDINGFMGVAQTVEAKEDAAPMKKEENLSMDNMEKFKPTTFIVNKDTKLFDKPGGKEVGNLKKGAQITSYQKVSSWLKISGTVQNKAWKKAIKEEWIKEGDVDEKR